MSAATDRAIERVEDWAGKHIADYEGIYPIRDLRKQLESLVMAGWNERKGPPPYD